MKNSKRIFIMMVASLLTATSLWASGNVSVITKLDGTVNANVGTVTYRVSESNGLCTLTVTPAEGYYVDAITAEKTISGDLAQSRGFRAPAMDNMLSVTPADVNADPSSVTVWTFQMPGSTDYDVEVVADFKQRVDISNAVVTLAETLFVYDGTPKTLNDTKLVLTDDEIQYELVLGVDYTINYADNTNVGTATATITGMGNYQGTLTKTFSIVRELNIRFSETNAWASYYAEENLQVPDGLMAYVVTGIDHHFVEVRQTDFIPMHQGVLLTYAEVAPEVITAEAYDGPVQESADNILKGCSASTAVSSLAGDDKSIYVLYNDEFVKTTKGSIPAFRCYLEVDGTEAAAQARLSINIDEETNGICEKAVVTKEPVAAVYDLNGRSVRNAPLKKGLFIVKGRKVVVK